MLLQPSRVDSASALVEHAADAARQHCAELPVVQSRQRSDRADAGGEQSFLGFRADARQPPYVEGREKGGLVARGDDGQAARLAVVARDLGDDLRAGDPD